MIYLINAITIITSEFLLWWLRASIPGKPRFLKRFAPEEFVYQILDRAYRCLGRANIRRANSNEWISETREQIQRFRRWWMDQTFTDRLGLLLHSYEVVNSIWLIYIIFAQTFGSYEVCMAGSQDSVLEG